MLVEKKSFSISSFHFERAGVSIPVEIGYESYGTLNSRKDNVVMICHYFTGTSHAAGKYSQNDELPGWWDTLVGPGKVVDTDRFYVLCSDCISNINFHNPYVITTGPASINPDTGKEYALTFPIFTIKDMVRLQRMLVGSLGIQKLQFVMGPSMGGLQAFTWGRYYPEMVENIVVVTATPMIRPYGIMIPNQLGIEAIRLDPQWNGGNYYDSEPPRRGLLLAFKILLMATRTDTWAESNFGRRLADQGFVKYKDPFTSFDGKFLVDAEVENIVLGRMQFFDANSYMYIAKANTLFDLRENGETLEEALRHIRARTLMIIDESDQIFTKLQAEEVRKFQKNCEVYYYNSSNGHLSCLFETNYFSEVIEKFMHGK